MPLYRIRLDERPLNLGVGAMSEDRADNARTASRRARTWKFAGAAASALVIAAVTAVGSGLGSSLWERVRGDPDVVTASSAREVLECGTAMFLSAPTAGDVATGAARPPADWRAFPRLAGAAVASNDAVEVAIQGESARTVTLTGIAVTTERAERPDGAVFTNPCGDATTGRAVRVDLDRTPPRIVASVADDEGVLPLVDTPGVRPPETLRFPWTVSLTDPLLLKIVATTRRCLCTWRAEIAWRSGGRSGTLRVDNDGAGYRVAGAAGLPHYIRSDARERGWIAASSDE